MSVGLIPISTNSTFTFRNHCRSLLLCYSLVLSLSPSLIVSASISKLLLFPVSFSNRFDLFIGWFVCCLLLLLILWYLFDMIFFVCLPYNDLWHRRLNLICIPFEKLWNIRIKNDDLLSFEAIPCSVCPSPLFRVFCIRGMRLSLETSNQTHFTFFMLLFNFHLRNKMHIQFMGN